MKKWKFGLYNFAILSLLFLNCGLFRTRSPQSPSGGGSVWQLPTIPSIVISNLKNSYEARNIENTLRSFSSNFIFLADPRDTLLAPRGKFANWNLSVETSVTNAIFGQGVITLIFSNPQENTSENTSLIYEDYELTIFSNPNLYGKGKAKFTLKKELDGLWYITLWEDTKVDTTDWGQIKGNFR